MRPAAYVPWSLAMISTLWAPRRDYRGCSKVVRVDRGEWEVKRASFGEDIGKTRKRRRERRGEQHKASETTRDVKGAKATYKGDVERRRRGRTVSKDGKGEKEKYACQKLGVTLAENTLHIPVASEDGHTRVRSTQINSDSRHDEVSLVVRVSSAFVCRKSCDASSDECIRQRQ